MYDWAEFRHFRYLLAVLGKGGFRVAAEELFTSQPNLTAHAKQFQENASLRLYRKLKNGAIDPTPTGKAFLTLVPQLLELRNEIIEALIAIDRGQVDSVHFGCTPLVDPLVFRRFCRLHREVVAGGTIRTTHGDTAHLVEEIVEGTLDAAIVTLPCSQPDLRTEIIRQDRLVVCLRKDDPLAQKATLHASDLQDNLTILHHPRRHPEAHQRLAELLEEAGVSVGSFSRASHPSEMQHLVKEGYGLALMREGTEIDPELTTRPIAGVTWTVDTAVIYHRERYPRTIPILVRKVKKLLAKTDGQTGSIGRDISSISAGKLPPSGRKTDPNQMSLLG